MHLLEQYCMMQSCPFSGVLCATFGIFWMGAKLEWRYIFFGGFGSVSGIVLGKI